LAGRGGKRVASEAMFYAFDHLYLDGIDLATYAMTAEVARHMGVTPSGVRAKLAERGVEPVVALRGNNCLVWRRSDVFV
jgi:hypothetical protein